MIRKLIAVLASGFAMTSIAVAQPAPAATPAPAAPPAPMIGPGGRFDVKTFGAKADGTTKDTAAFQKALDTCAVNGGGEVVVPAGTYLIGSIQIGDHTTLRLEQGSILNGSPDVDEDYPMSDVRWEGRWMPGHRGLIYANAVDHIGIVGPGQINGSPWGTNGAGGIRNPVVVEPINCTNVLWDGFTVKQGGHWATHPTYCTDLTIKNCSITGNRDGIDVDSCKNVTIDSCTIDTGDDSISLKSGRGMDGARLARPCENITITNCTLTDRTFACVGIGSETSGGVKNVKITHCKMNAVRSPAIYIKTRIGRAGGNENISADDVDVNAQIFLRINLVSGGNTSTADDPVEGMAGYPYANNLSFTNIRVTCTDQLVEALKISDKRPLKGLTLMNITGTAVKGITLANIIDAKLSNIKVTGADGGAMTTPLLLAVNTKGTGLEGATAIEPPVDPPPGNARGGFGGGRRGGAPGAPGAAGADAAGGAGGFGARGGGRGRRGGAATAPAAGQ